MNIDVTFSCAELIELEAEEQRRGQESFSLPPADRQASLSSPVCGDTLCFTDGNLNVDYTLPQFEAHMFAQGDERRLSARVKLVYFLFEFF